MIRKRRLQHISAILHHNRPCFCVAHLIRSLSSLSIEGREYHGFNLLVAYAEEYFVEPLAKPGMSFWRKLATINGTLSGDSNFRKIPVPGASCSVSSISSTLYLVDVARRVLHRWFDCSR
uniref:Uncharacterized protein n=1 Tax=Glossina austeni TaxID=7395 RepID=A0A1A9V8K5_GLOAU